LIDANINQETEKIDNALQIIRTLYETWQEAIENECKGRG